MVLESVFSMAFGGICCKEELLVSRQFQLLSLHVNYFHEGTVSRVFSVT